VITISPSVVSRDPASRAARAFTEGDSDGDPLRSNRNCAADDTLLTFCPPGPEAWMKLSEMSRSSKAIWSVTRIMRGAFAVPGRLLMSCAL
jgi:hypothetical protein